MTYFFRLLDGLWRAMRRRLGLRGIASVLLLAGALQAAEGGLSAAGPRSEDLFTYSALAVLVGWVTIRKRRWPLRLAAWLALGAAILFILNAGLWDELVSLFRSAVSFLNAWSGEWFRRVPDPDLAARTALRSAFLRLAWLQFSGGLRIENAALASWLAGFAQGARSLRHEAAPLVLGPGFWALGLYAGAAMRRTGSALAALLPAGILLALAQARVDASNTLALTAFLLAALLLAAVQVQYGNERRWARRGMMYAEDMRMDFTIAASILVAGIIAITYAVPQLELGTAIREFVDRAARSSTAFREGGRRDAQVEPAGAAGPTPVPFFDRYRLGGMPRSHLLGAGPELADVIALTVHVVGEPAPGAARYYWRGLSYEIYTGAGWEVGETRLVGYPAGWQVARPVEGFTHRVRQEVIRGEAPAGIAYAAGEVLSADRDFTIAWLAPGAGQADVFGVRIEPDEFTIDSNYPYFAPELLRAAGTAYPDLIAGRYLALPETVPARVRALAASLTAEAENPYDRAAAIERHLRGYEYTLELGPPPAGVDIADHFLFDLRRGYCDYFATAMVVLSRAAGIPARLATGYAGGEYDPDSGRYVVSGLNAHSWPELYFPGFGWVPFEPTSGVAAIDWDAFDGFPDGPFPELPPLAPPAPGWLEPVRTGIWIAAAAAVAALAGRALVESFRIRRLDASAFYAEAYQWVYAAGRQLGVSAPARATPLEIEAALSAALDDLRMRGRLPHRLPPAGPDLARLTDAYIRSQYGRRQPDADEKAAGIRSLRRLRLVVRIARLSRLVRPQ